MLNATNSKKQGDIGLGNAIAYFASNQYTVCIPLTDSQDYDLIVEDKDKNLLKIQVKTTKYKSKYGYFEVGLRICGGNSGRVLKHFDSNECDALFILCESGERYFIPRKEIDSSSCITLGKKYAKYLV